MPTDHYTATFLEAGVEMYEAWFNHRADEIAEHIEGLEDAAYEHADPGGEDDDRAQHMNDALDDAVNVVNSDVRIGHGYVPNDFASYDDGQVPALPADADGLDSDLGLRGLADRIRAAAQQAAIGAAVERIQAEAGKARSIGDDGGPDLYADFLEWIAAQVGHATFGG